MKRMLLAVLAVLAATPAFAHAKLVQETPADKTAVTASPTQLSLKFSENIELSFSGATITGPDQKALDEGALALDPKDKSTLTVPLKSPLPAGVYTVSWHVVSSDGQDAGHVHLHGKTVGLRNQIVGPVAAANRSHC